MRDLVDTLNAVPSGETPRIQECHILVGHALCDAVEQTLANLPAFSGIHAGVKG
jgi:D-sedoheptulose 7-phosphate isomerase